MRLLLILLTFLLAACTNVTAGTHIVRKVIQVPVPTKYLPVGAAAQAVPAFYEACNRITFLCQNRTADPLPDSELMRRMEIINYFVNTHIKPADDFARTGKEDYWTTAQSGFGDCEDYALLKMMNLLDQGASPQQVFMATGKAPNGEYHAILIVRTTKADFVLDNLTDQVLPWYDSLVKIDRVQSNEDRTQWYRSKPEMRDISTASN